jgi:hypothetical protein
VQGPEIQTPVPLGGGGSIIVNIVVRLKNREIIVMLSQNVKHFLVIAG